MRISTSWLKEFVELRWTPEELARRLTMAGLAVVGIEADAGIPGEAVLEVELTSNRPDALGHLGVAREVAALSGQDLRSWSSAAAVPATPPAIRVAIDAAAACRRYCALELRDVQVTTSAPELAARLERMGARSINNFADLTNYVLFETGHPTHAFDADTLRGGELRIRFARPGERLLLLDGTERQLDGDDLIIADAERPVALAGVMGGLETAISERTRQVVLESAWFDPQAVRRTARRHGLHTEASHRFERGADPEMASIAARRLETLARKHAWVAGAPRTLLSVDAGAFPARNIRLRHAAVQRLLGTAPAPAAYLDQLRRIGFTSAPLGDGAWSLTVPSWRPDVEREVDLIEEIARLAGYDRFPPRLPAFAGAAQPHAEAALRERLRRQLLGHGFAEAVALSFASRDECASFTAAEPVEILNPLSAEASIMRTSSVPSMLHLLRNNLNRGAEQLRLFEIGSVYRRQGNGAAESPVLTLGAVGLEATDWAGHARPFDFFDLKGEVLALLDAFAVPPGLPQQSDAAAWLHPGRRAAVRHEGRLLAQWGQLHPEIAAAWKLKASVFVAEIHLEALLPLGPRAIHYRPPSRFPESSRDFSFQFADNVTWERIQHAIALLVIAELAAVEPLEVFRGAAIPAGNYSLLLRARFQGADRTLKDEEVQAWAQAIVAALQALGGQQR